MIKGAYNKPRTQARERINLNVISTTVAEISAEAEARGVPFATFVAAILDVIAREKMFDAVLDGDMPRVKEGA